MLVVYRQPFNQSRPTFLAYAAGENAAEQQANDMNLILERSNERPGCVFTWCSSRAWVQLNKTHSRRLAR